MDHIWGEDKSNNKKTPKAGEDAPAAIEVVGNHIYFYNGVDKDTALAFNKTLQDTVNKLKGPAFINYGIDKPEIHIHMNSGGGSVFAGISMMETVLRLKKFASFTTHVEGIVASAATFISVIGDKRVIHPHSYMLIHQLSGFVFGNYAQMKDTSENVDELMSLIKEMYREYSEVPMKKIDEILSHDLYFNADKCVEYGLVDEIWKN